ncbi:hypothetical protein [Burkholderia ubonensis]|nr:hypothetical protein [Burkholderia ubonensis]
MDMKWIYSGIRVNRNLKYSAALSRVSLRRRKFAHAFDAAYLAPLHGTAA